MYQITSVKGQFAQLNFKDRSPSEFTLRDIWNRLYTICSSTQRDEFVSFQGKVDEGRKAGSSRLKRFIESLVLYAQAKVAGILNSMSQAVQHGLESMGLSQVPRSLEDVQSAVDARVEKFVEESVLPHEPTQPVTA